MSGGGFTFIGLLVVAAAVVLASARIAAAIAAFRREAAIRHLQATFVPGLQAVEADARQFLVWHPLAQASRRLFPEAFRALDEASGGTFPFSRERLEEAHAHWTAAWLAWETTHDGEYTLKAAALQAELAAAGKSATPLGRAQLAALEREKVERYQERYRQYIQTAKALQALAEAGPKG
jgi:hypothetical protein